MSNNLIKNSDKTFWHRFTPIYEEKLKETNKFKRILEFGVFNGNSIRWLNKLFPEAEIFGSDILPIQKNWPIEKNIKYLHVDQGDPSSILKIFHKINNDLDLIIEDGSHFPIHQRNCLVESLKHISSGGVYILEDIHTSHPEHTYYKKNIKNNIFNIFQKKKTSYISSLHLLLCLEHLNSNKKELNDNLLKEISLNSLFSRDDIVFIFDKISKIEIFKRGTLPHNCYSCDSSDFDYHYLKCKCGVDIYSNSDSMTAIITVK